LIRPIPPVHADRVDVKADRNCGPRAMTALPFGSELYYA
jgi:hypothetical protein